MSDGKGLPDGWVATTMESLGSLLCGTSPTTATVNKNGEGTPYVSGPEQWDGYMLHLDKWTTEPRRVVPDGCIFITVKGAGVGKLFPGQAVAIGRDIYAFLPHEGIDRRLVQNALQATIYDVVRQAKGDIPGLSKPHILEHPITLPPAREQTRIADRIDELFTDLAAGVAALERVRKKLKRYRSAVLHAAVTGRLTEAWRHEHGPPGESGEQLLERLLVERRRQWEERTQADYEVKGATPPKNWRERYKEPIEPKTDDLPELPEGWCWASQDQIGEVQLGRQRSPEHHSGEHMRPYLRVANVFEDRISTKDVKSMNFTPREFEAYQLKHGDLLLNEGQSMELIGRPAMYRDEIPGCCFQNTLVRQRVGHVVLAEYALSVLLAQFKTGRYRKIARITTSIAHLGAERFAGLEFPLPPIAEQQAIVELVQEKFSQIDGMEAEVNRGLARAARLRQAILKAAFAGDLVKQDPQDEPASVLLDRIRTEREAIAAVSNGRPKRSPRKKAAPKKTTKSAKKASPRKARKS
ncbi:restriction endonuclease subunit S [Aeoliella sp. SH292]|uniref:restriction endonuclease subunit S n=1 Tax=Aeoliella sp. SH292 TaxID=3454464 RepID=UPI003F9A9EE1